MVRRKFHPAPSEGFGDREAIQLGLSATGGTISAAGLILGRVEPPCLSAAMGQKEKPKGDNSSWILICPNFPTAGAL